MKIRIINNKNNKLFEAENAPLTSPTKSEAKELTAAQMLNKGAQEQFMIEKRQESLPIHISIPDTFMESVDIPRAPEDINNLIRSFKTNKARKTENIGGVMVDPEQTFNNAEDYCNVILGKFFSGNDQISFTKNKEKIDQNKTTVRKDSKEIGESLNEAGEAVATGLSAGQALGNAGVAGLKFLGGLGAGLAQSLAGPITALVAGSYVTGASLQAVLGDGTGHGFTDDRATTHLASEDKNMIDTSAKMPQQRGNIVAQLDSYISKITDSTRDLLSGISPQSAKQFAPIREYINGFKTAEIDGVKSFITKNSESLNKQREIEQQRRELKLQQDKTNAEKQVKFMEEVEKLIAKSPNGITYFGKLSQLRSFYVKNIGKENGFKLDDALENGSLEEIFKLANITLTENIDVNTDISSIMSLNEAEETSKEKPVLPLGKYYENIKTELENKFGKIIDEFDPKTLTNLDETKQEMQKLITAADNEIKHKIEIITKAPTGENYGKESGLGSAAIKFLAGHPLEAETLQGIWSRHLGDLQNRMNTRIKQMTDFNNPGRILGWTKKLLGVIVPDILARLLVLRYGYAVLSQEGIYNYDTEKTKQDLAQWEIVKGDYETANRSKLIWLLNQYSKDYTDSGESCFIEGPEGGFIMNDGGVLTYGSFLLDRIGPTKQNPQLINDYSILLANVNKAKDKTEVLLNLIYENMATYYKQLLNSDTKGLNKLADQFKMRDDIKQNKELIRNTYNFIVEQGIKIINDDKATAFAQSMNVIVNNPDIYNIYVKNQKEIDNLINLASAEDPSINNSDDIKKGVEKYFGNINFELEDADEKVSKDTISKLFKTDTDIKQEYYTYILSWFGQDNMKNIKVGDETITRTRSDEGIKKVCQAVPALIKIAVSGILATTIEKQKTNPTDNLKKSLTTIKNVYNTLENSEKVINKLKKSTDPKVKENAEKLYNRFNSLLTTIKEESLDYYHGENKNKERFTDETIKMVNNNIGIIVQKLEPFKEINDKTLIAFKESIKDLDVLNKEGNSVKFGDNDINQDTIINGLAELFNNIQNNKSYDKLAKCISVINNNKI